MPIDQLALADLRVAAKAAGLPPIITLREAAEFARIAVRTLRRWIKQGRVRAIKTDPGQTGLLRLPLEPFLKLLAGAQTVYARSLRSGKPPASRAERRGRSTAGSGREGCEPRRAVETARSLG